MKLKSVFVLSITSVALLSALDMPPMPPKLVTKSVTSSTKKESTLPKSCQMLPPMVFKLPPPMEIELTKCKNELYFPTKFIVEKNLSKFLKRKIVVSKIEIVKDFKQLYRVTYNGGIILVNSAVNAFIKQ